LLNKKGEEILTQINYEKLPSFELGMEKGMQRGMEKGKIDTLKKAVKAIYSIEKNPDKIAEMLNEDRVLIYSIFDTIQKN